MIDFETAQKLILAEKARAVAHGRAEDSWYFFHNHVYGSAAVAKAIAEHIGLNPQRAALSALLHDIGKIRESSERRFHGIIGYEMLKDLDVHIARAALVHTFPNNQIGSYEKCAGMFFAKRADYDFLAGYLAAHPADDYDRLVQLTDGLANAYGFVTLEQRAEEYARRRGVAVSDYLVGSVLELKKYFDRKLGGDIYALFKQIDTKNLFLSADKNLRFAG